MSKLNKRELQMLEWVWVAEIKGRLPLQTNSKVAEKLFLDGLLIRGSIVISGARVEGYWLSHAGRLSYCMNCDDFEESRNA
ncbi:hypothetical protein [Azorhizophilus paspali]|uniref:Uncharacterized protein n=1 Tax=Azorhizophilus paspali TaxID=69963 RepID=A0ABV6SHF2_AZOPA